MYRGECVDSIWGHIGVHRLHGNHAQAGWYARHAQGHLCAESRIRACSVGLILTGYMTLMDPGVGLEFIKAKQYAVLKVQFHIKVEINNSEIIQNSTLMHTRINLVRDV